jgi:hypothetical protein
VVFKLRRKKSNLRALLQVFLKFLTHKGKSRMKLSMAIKGKNSILQNLWTTDHVFGTLHNTGEEETVKIYLLETIIGAIYMHLLYFRNFLS